MPPYFRLPEKIKGINQQFWGCQPRNPTCGLVSLEMGTKIFVWANIIYGGFATLTAIDVLLNPLVKGLRANIPKDTDASKVYILNHNEQMMHLSKIFLAFIVFSFWLYVSLKLRKSAAEKNISPLKKDFFLMLCTLIPLSLAVFVETDALIKRPLFVDIPVVIFEIMGLIFTHSYIVSLINPPVDSVSDDLNRIQ